MEKLSRDGPARAVCGWISDMSGLTWAEHRFGVFIEFYLYTPYGNYQWGGKWGGLSDERNSIGKRRLDITQKFIEAKYPCRRPNITHVYNILNFGSSDDNPRYNDLCGVVTMLLSHYCHFIWNTHFKEHAQYGILLCTHIVCS